MKRFLYPILWICLISGVVLLPFIFEEKSTAQPLVAVQLQKKISRDILEKIADGESLEPVHVIIQPKGQPNFLFDTALSLAGGSDIKKLNLLNARVITVPAASVVTLASRSDVAYVSLDRAVQSMGHLSKTTGADVATGFGSGTSTGLDGSGIGIAIVDSGIDDNHVSFLDRLNSNRIVYSEDFTGEDRVDDPYGHGTHVASLAAGNGRVASAKFLGIAPEANLINLRVLNEFGVGTTSSVLRALDWIATNRTIYNIRVVNLSLGMPAIDSYKHDPICLAVRRLVDQGVVVFAAAGNNGKDSEGNKVYGHIHSPGNEPSAITVGATNTFGTDGRGDDTIATYSSRGPTRSFVVDDESGERHYDNLIKPDIVAPGNKLIEAEADQNYLVTQNPSLDAGVSNVNNRRMMYMSGTSMATPVAAGAAALMLQANPQLTPSLVKALVMYSAQPLAGFNMLEQGAGQLNIAGAVNLAQLVRTDLTSSTTVGSPLLTSAAPAAQTTLYGHTFSWSRGIILHHTYAVGEDLITKYQLNYGLGKLLGTGVVTGDGVLTLDPNFFSNGVVTGDQILTSDGVVTGDGLAFLAVNWLFQDLLAEGQLLGDGVVTGDGIINGDGVVTGDLVAEAQSAMMNGDSGASMSTGTDDGSDFLGY